MNSLFDSIPRMPRVTPAKAAEIVADFRNYPPPDIEGNDVGNGVFPSESMAKGPAAILPVFGVLEENTVERDAKFTPYFTGATKKQISKAFALGLTMIAKYQPFFALWCPDPRYPPSERAEGLRLRFGRHSEECKSLGAMMKGASKAQVDMKCTLEDRHTPIPFWQNYNCCLLFLLKATLRTKPELLKVLTKAGAFQIITDLLRNETDRPPSDFLQQQFCEFVGEFQGDKSIMKRLYEAGAIPILVSFATSPHQKVRQFSASLIGSVQSVTKQGTMAKTVRPDSVQGIVDTLMTCDKTDLTQQTLCSLINDMMMADEDAKDQLCQPRNMIRMLKLIEEATNSRGALFCQDESHASVQHGHTVAYWNAKSLIHAICNSLGGSEMRQKLAAGTCGERLLTRLKRLLVWFADASPIGDFADMGSILCDLFYKMITRSVEGRLVVDKVGAPMPLLRRGNLILRLASGKRVEGHDSLTQAQIDAVLSGQCIVTALEAAKAAVVANGEYFSSRELSMNEMLPDMEGLIYGNFQMAIDLLASSSSQRLLSVESVTLAVMLINASLFCHKPVPEVSFLKRVIRYLQVRTAGCHDNFNLPYLTVLSDIQSRNTEFAFQNQGHLIKSVDDTVEMHHGVLRNFCDRYNETSAIARALDRKERDTLEWVRHKVTAGSMISFLAARSSGCSEPEEDPLGVCRAFGCANKENLKICACRKVAYCGKDCQRKDWPNHKKACKEARKAAKSAKASSKAM